MTQEVLLTSLQGCLRSPEPLARMRALLVAEVEGGASCEELMVVLQDLRADLAANERDDGEDVALDAMDVLVGWCGPNLKI